MKGSNNANANPPPNNFMGHGAHSLQRGAPSRLNLDKLCQFESSRARSREVEEYLSYVRTIFPNESNNLGVLMHAKIDETAALEVLHQSAYETDTAKFLATFPALARQMRVRKWGADLSSERLAPVFEKYVSMNSRLHLKNEATHFTRVLRGIEAGRLDMSFDQLSEVIMDARSNKYKLPASVRKLFEDSFNGSRDIEKMLEGSKKMDDLQLLSQRLGKLLVPPQNFFRLEEFLGKARGFEAEVVELMTGGHRNFKDMQAKMNCLKMLGLKTCAGDPVHEFKELWEKSHRYLEDIQQIVNPYNTKSNQRKSDFLKAEKILNYFILHRVQDPKIDALCELVNETRRIENVARLFLEDARPAHPRFLEKTLGFLEKSRFDMKALVERVREKGEYLEELDLLQKTWSETKKIGPNLKRIQRLKRFKKTENLGKIEELEANVHKLQRVW